MKNEVWKDIPNYEGLYQVSNLGRVKSLNYRKTNREKILKERKSNRYISVALWKDKKRTDTMVHRIVAKVFVENNESKPFVNHKDENTYNNNAENLMWCTHKENMNWGTRNERISNSNKNNFLRCKKVAQFDKNNNFLKIWNSIKEASNELNINRSHISCCCNNKYGRKTCGGYIWKYADDLEK